MLRFTIAALFAIVAIEPALSADRALAPYHRHHSVHRAAVDLPRGLPRPHYRFRTTISYGPRVFVHETPRLVYSPVYVDVPYIPALVDAPLLPGSSTLPGYYGSHYTYEYQGPYYGGPYTNYWDRLPYACGVYGYC